MTTKEACRYLGKNELFLIEMAKKAFILPGWANHEQNQGEWLDDDVIRVKVLLDYGVINDWTPGQKMDVLYCRTEPGIEGLSPASKRVDEQKERMLNWILGREMQVDLVLKETRPVMRYRELGINLNDENNPSAFQCLMGLLSRRKVRTLYIESRDRISIGSSWYIIEDLCKIGKCEIIVMNSIWPTDEMRAEAFGWMQDMLLWYKMMTGEVKTQSVIDTYMKGFDPRQTLKYINKIDAKYSQVQKAKRLKVKKWMKLPAKQRVLDLDDCWDEEDIYKARQRLGLPSPDRD